MQRWAGIGIAVVVVVLLVAWQAGGFTGWGTGGRDDCGCGGAEPLEAAREATSASAPGPTLAGRDGKPLPISVPSPVVTGPRVTGRVVDTAGRGIPGARIVSIPDTATKTFSFADLGKDGSPAFGATADAEGRFTVAVLKDAPFHLILADSPGFAIAAKPEVPNGGDVVITLEPARVLTGIVQDRDGAPIVGARVRALLLIDALMLEREARSGPGGATASRTFPPSIRSVPGGGLATSRDPGSK